METPKDIRKEKDGREYIKLYLDRNFGQQVQMNLPNHKAVGMITSVIVRQGHAVYYGVTWGDMQERFHANVELKNYEEAGTETIEPTEEGENKDE